jgi:hypothetical protein
MRRWRLHRRLHADGTTEIFDEALEVFRSLLENMQTMAACAVIDYATGQECVAPYVF